MSTPRRFPPDVVEAVRGCQVLGVRAGTGKPNGWYQTFRRQAQARAEFQQATRDLENHVKDGKDLAIRIRNGIRMTYGLRAEKLAEFGLQPRRSRKKQKPQEVPAKTTPTADSKTGPIEE